jgi:flagellar basal-body rod protein FlgB
MNSIFDRSLTDLSNALDVRAAKHSALQGDLANIDTPGFVPEDVDFDAAMGALAAGDGGGVTVDEATAQATASLDGNRVDADRTMAALAENALQYSAATRVASKKLALLRYVAGDGVG